MHDDTLFGETLAVLLGYHEGMVARRGEDGGHKGLVHLRHLRGKILQEGLVPDSPRAVEVVVAVEPLVALKVLATVILLETRTARKSLETHRTALGSMEEGGMIAFGRQQRGNAADVVERGRRQEERLDKHRYAAEYRRHTIN